MSFPRREALRAATEAVRREYGGYKCTSCHQPMAVLDSRPIDGGIRRRRECKCGHRETTYETNLDPAMVMALMERARRAAEDFLKDIPVAVRTEQA